MSTEPPFISNPDDPRHGTKNGYDNLNCRCDRCREAHRIAHREYMERHPEQVAKHRARRKRRWMAIRA